MQTEKPAQSIAVPSASTTSAPQKKCGLFADEVEDFKEALEPFFRRLRQNDSDGAATWGDAVEDRLRVLNRKIYHVNHAGDSR